MAGVDTVGSAEEDTQGHSNKNSTETNDPSLCCGSFRIVL